MRTQSKRAKHEPEAKARTKGSVHTTLRRRSDLPRGKARRDAAITDDTRKVLIPAEGFPGYQPAEVAATRPSASNRKRAALEVLRRAEGATPARRSDRRRCSTRGRTDMQASDDSGSDGNAERCAEATPPKERVLSAMQVLETDAVDVMEVKRTTATDDGVEVAASDRSDGAERGSSKRNDVRHDVLLAPRGPGVLPSLTRSNTREERAVHVGAEGVAARWKGVADDDIAPSQAPVIAEDKMARALTPRCDAGDVKTRLLSRPNAIRRKERTPGTDPEVMAARQREDVAHLVAAKQDVEAHVGIEGPTG